MLLVLLFLLISSTNACSIDNLWFSEDDHSASLNPIDIIPVDHDTGAYNLSITYNFTKTEEVKSIQIHLYLVNATEDECEDNTAQIGKDEKLHSYIVEDYLEDCRGKLMHYSAPLAFLVSGCYYYELLVMIAEKNPYKRKYQTVWVNNTHGLNDFLHPVVGQMTSEGLEVQSSWWVHKNLLNFDYSIQLGLCDDANANDTWLPSRKCKRYNNDRLYYHVADVTDNCTISEVKGTDLMNMFCNVTRNINGTYQYEMVFYDPFATEEGLYSDYRLITCKPVYHSAKVSDPTVVLAESSTMRFTIVVSSCCLLLVAMLVGLSFYSPLLTTGILRKIKKREFTPLPNPPERERHPPSEILLVYARDCLPFMDVMVVLRRLLNKYCNVQVWDLFSEEFLRDGAAASAPEQWLHARCACDAVKVVLVRNPAGAALYEPSFVHHEGHIDVEPPLLGKYIYRSHQHMDHVLNFLFSIVRNDFSHKRYTKYYVAQIPNIPGFPILQQLSQVTPHKSYELPDILETLIKELMEWPDHPQLEPEDKQALQLVVEKFKLFAAKNPEYLYNLVLPTC